MQMGRIVQLVCQLAHAVQAAGVVPIAVRKAILRLLGVRIGTNVNVYPHVFFGSGKCSIGSGSLVNVNCFFDGSDQITIGTNVAVAAGVQLITSTHEIGTDIRRAGALRTAPIFVGNGCWLGASSMVLPGVAIAEGCVIAAGAVVSKNTEPNGLYVGVPARRVRTFEV